MSNSYSQNQRGNQDNIVNNLILEIDRLDSLSELKPKKYADEKGYADKIAKNFSSGRDDSQKLNTNQLRKFFGAIRDIESKEGSWKDIEAQFYLLKPKLAVSAGRKLIPKDFHKLMMTCMKKSILETKKKNMKILRL